MLGFLNPTWALQGINLGPAGAHCSFPSDQNRRKSFNRFEIAFRVEIYFLKQKMLYQQSAPRLDFGCPDLLLCAPCTPRKASLDAVIPAPASRAPASLRLFLQCASKQYHLPSDVCLSLTGPSVSVRCRWHEAHVGNSQLLHRLCGTTGLTFLDPIWALQGINFGPAGAHCGFPGDQNRQNHSIASKSHLNCFQKLRKSRFSFGVVAFFETTRSSRSIFQKDFQYGSPERLWDEPRGAAGRLQSINFSPQDAPRRRLPRPSDAPRELVLRTSASSVAGLGANAPTGSGHRAVRLIVWTSRSSKSTQVIAA